LAETRTGGSRKKWGAGVFDKLRSLAGGKESAANGRSDARGSSRSLPGIALPTRQVIAHPRFVITLTIWGAAMGALGVLALSSVDIARISMVANLGALGALARFLCAAIAAAIGGITLLAAASLVARFLSPRGRSCFFASLGEERIRPIDPATELGSESLDAPLEHAPFSRRQEQPLEREQIEAVESEEALADKPPIEDQVPDLVIDGAIDGAITGDDTLELDASSALDDEAAGPTADDAQAHDAGIPQALPDGSPEAAEDEGLDLAAFAQILEDETLALAQVELEPGPQSGSEEVPEPVSQPGSESGSLAGSLADLQAPIPTTGIAKLRATPTEELSLVQLVERFAAALHEAQEAAPQDLAGSEPGAGDAEREQALAAALKALHSFTGDGLDQKARAAMAGATGSEDAASQGQENPDERDLREALSQLQKVRGAA
jgi:hypothetical protein